MTPGWSPALVGGFEGLFLWLVIGVTAVGVILAVVNAMVGGMYEQIGQGGLSLDRSPPPPAPDTPAGQVERREEIRQLIEARSARRQARGQEPLDVEAEVAAAEQLAEPSPTVDPALREEIRGLVVARNERRARQGKAPLDVEEEIDRQVRELGRGGPSRA